MKGQLTILTPQNVVAECLETAFGLKAYTGIINEVAKTGFKATPEFRKVYNAYFRVRQRALEWYDEFYAQMEAQKITRRSFGELLRIMQPVNGKLEVSFISKLIATIDPEQPIWDQYVIKNLGFYRQWENARTKPVEYRLNLANDIYDAICSWYDEFIDSKEGRECIHEFDVALPDYQSRLTAAKKVDYLLWSKR